MRVFPDMMGKTIVNFTEQGLPSNDVGKIIEDDSGNLWFSILRHGLLRYDGKALRIFLLKMVCPQIMFGL